jgi:hypothetical protein
VAYTFDGPNKLVVLTSGTTEFDVQDLYSRWVDWVVVSDNSKYLPAMRAVGGDPISDTKNLGATFFMATSRARAWATMLSCIRLALAVGRSRNS